VIKQRDEIDQSSFDISMLINDYRDPNEYEWSLIWIPLSLNTLLFCLVSIWRMTYQRINHFRQLRQLGITVRGFVRSSRVHQSEDDGIIHQTYFVTVRFPFYYQLPMEPNYNGAASAERSTGPEPRRIHGWAQKEYTVPLEVYEDAVRTSEIAMIFDTSAVPNGIAAPAYLVHRPASVGIISSTISLLIPMLLLSLLGVVLLPQCAPLDTGPCIPYWLVGWVGPILILLLCCICPCPPLVCNCGSFIISDGSDLEFEMEES